MLQKFLDWVSGHLNESKKNQYEYGCAMVYFDLPQLYKLQDGIDPADLYSEESERYGLENEPHVTLLYGFHKEVSPEQVFQICKNHNFSELKLHNTSCFNNDQYDVLKFDVGYRTESNDFLHKCNAELTELPHTTNFPDYHPHATIGYFKKGKGQHYADLFNKYKFFVNPNKIVYSAADGTKHEMQL